jgi:uncharacterized protein (TIGR00251 family)
VERKKEAGQPKKKFLTVRVRPGSRRAGVEKLAPEEYKVSVLSPAEKGEANKEVVARLAEYFGIPPSRLRIVRGEKSRLKLIAIDSDE